MAFAHSLLRDAAWAMLSTQERAKLRLLAAGILQHESSAGLLALSLQAQVDPSLARRAADDEAARNNLVVALEIYQRLANLTEATWQQRFEAQDQVSRLLERQGRIEESQASAQAGLRIAESSHEPGLLGRAHLRVGALLRRRAQHDEALRVLLRAEELSLSANDTLSQAEAVSERGLAHDATGEFSRAEACFVAAERLFRRRGQLEGVCRMLGNLARVHGVRGQATAALAMLSEADDLAQILGNKLLVARICGNRANLLAEAGDPQGALDNYQRALAAFEACGDARGIASTHANLGAHFEQQGDYAAAERHLASAERFALEQGDARLAARVTGNRGVLCAANGDRVAALNLLRQALSRARALDDREHLAQLLANIARLLFLGAEPQSALAAVDESLKMFQVLGLAAESAAMFALRAKVLLAAGLGARAQQAALDALDWCDAQRQNGTQSQFDALAVLAVYESRFGDPREAEALANEAEDVALQLSSRSRPEAEAAAAALKTMRAELVESTRDRTARA